MSQEAVDQPHGPETTGPVKRLLGDYHVTGLFWYRFHRWGLSILPEFGIYFFVTLFTLFFFFVLRRIRRAIASNLDAACGDCGWLTRQQRIWLTMWNFAWCLSERYEALDSAVPMTVEADGDDYLATLVGQDRGLILVTGHVGQWDIGALEGLARMQRRVHVVRAPEADPEAQKFIEEIFNRRSTGLNFEIHFAKEKDRGLGMTLLAALRRGEIVALQGDRPLANQKSTGGLLFGRPFETTLGPYQLARSADVPLLPVFVFRRSRRKYLAAIRRPIHIPRAKNRIEELTKGMQKQLDEVAWAIGKEPHQWFCFKELWP